MASTLLFPLILLLSLFSLSSPLSSSAILDAAEILSSIGFKTMALNLELASQTLNAETSSLTIFALSDTSFKHMGQLPLSLLHYHLLPHAFSLQSLNSLPFGAKIGTMLPGHSVVVTTSHFGDRIGINNITVNKPPIFYDGYLSIFRINEFFDPYFQIPRKIPKPSLGPGCMPLRKSEKIWFSESYSFQEASKVLRSKGCSIMASLLDMQFLGPKERPQLTLFAPVDEGMVNHLGNLSDYSSILRHHLVPCKILWSDLVTLDDGSEFWTYERGFTINVTKSGDILYLNGVAVIFPEMYYSDWLVVHGLPEMLPGSKGSVQAAKAEHSSQTQMGNEQAREPSNDENELSGSMTRVQDAAYNWRLVHGEKELSGSTGRFQEAETGISSQTHMGEEQTREPSFAFDQYNDKNPGAAHYHFSVFH
ncbi:hypothetical protein L6164_001623 [Bauhinia variegata]|uniref:Uncharacterized protein n=1 Tax=Bauhinia variegata TaxID=167791 RepID=A0ACB9Q9C5_BAUVA|nr:hypothetical protein L6164_001623 [Bauhinia variegata]